MFDMYIASCHEEGGIYHFKTDGAELEKKQFLPLDRPMYMQVFDGCLYAVLRDPRGDGLSRLVSFVLDGEGNLTENIEEVSTKGVVGCHLAVGEQGCFVANYLSSSVFKVPDLLVEHSGRVRQTERQDAPHPHCTVFTPDKKYICVADLGMDKVFIYDTELELKGTLEFPSGSGPRHIIFSEDGERAFVITELSNKIFSFDYSGGKFKRLDTVSTLPEGFKGENTAAAIRIKGDRLYASNRGHNSIAVYRLDGGLMTEPEWVDCGGDGPRDFNIIGDLLVCTNEKSGNVTFFRLKDGLPELADRNLSLASPLNVIFG